ncbi:MAG: hypothetical protein P4L69_08505 [Desulfosporosinus sp.]|nr:hypothetical protein [Desulfosporosinus sp.]
MLNVLPFVSTTILIIGLALYTKFPFEVADYIRAPLFIYIGGMIMRGMMQGLFYDTLVYNDLDQYYTKRP